MLLGFWFSWFRPSADRRRS